ncbi:MAG TPA: hypothetical protein VFB58_00505 [Chloroflexota bacterium]|nr:hypothetical protein [Chloroflexota bacterium]
MTAPLHPEMSAWYANGSDKVCTKCGRRLPESAFSFKYKKLNLLHTNCRSCQVPMRHAAYEKNKLYYQGKIEQRQRELLVWFEEFKRSLSCIRCGFSHPAAIQFHHRDRRKKDVEVYIAVRRGWSKEHILREIEKCDPLCANCHFIEHWMERGRSRLEAGSELTGEMRA